MDFVVDGAHGAANLAQTGACVVADFLLRGHAAPDFRGKIRQRHQSLKPTVQGIPVFVGVLPSAVVLYAGADFQQAADAKELFRA